MNSDRKALEGFDVDNEELEALEKRLDQFNIFDAIGVRRQELRHSSILASLLDPQQNHGLGDAFVKQLLRAVRVHGADLPVSLIDLDVQSLDGAIVHREWQNIDILVLDETHKLAIIIENKVDSNEHSDQLNRYYEKVRAQHDDWCIIALYLTPDGKVPSDKRYIAVNYEVVCELVQNLAEGRKPTLGVGVQNLMLDYARMLRRHIVSESDIDKLCHQIYKRHTRALDLIYDRVDPQAMFRKTLASLVQQEPDLEEDEDCTRTSLCFFMTEWSTGSCFEPLYFEFDNPGDRVVLRLWIETEDESNRRALYEMAKASPLLEPAVAFGKKPKIVIYKRDFLTFREFEDSSVEQREEKIRRNWSAFLAHDLPQIRSAFSQLSAEA